MRLYLVMFTDRCPTIRQATNTPLAVCHSCEPTASFSAVYLSNNIRQYPA